MRRTTPQEEPTLTPEQQQIMDRGLRILARMIVRRYMKDSATGPELGGDATHSLRDDGGGR